MNEAPGKALVMGLGNFGGGVGAAKYLLQQGWEVCVTDLGGPQELAASLAELAGLPLRFVLGEHREEDFRWADLVLANPAVAPTNRFLQLAREHGARLRTEIELLLGKLEARLVLVTGTQGKSSTCHLLHTLLQAGGARVFLGGNIGVSLLGELGNIAKEDFVVLELSSYQLEALASFDGGAPLCAAEAVCVTNLLPDHLERHGSFEAYGQAKRRILDLLAADGVALIGEGAPLAHWLPPRGRRLSFGETGADLLIEDGYFQTRAGTRLASLSSLALPGRFQRLNALAALGIAHSMGLSPELCREALPRAPGLEHRLQCLGEIGGLRIHDNAVSTTPDSTIAALCSLPKGLHLMMGGRSKGLPLGELARVVRERASGVTLFGEARAELAQALSSAGVTPVLCEDLQTAVESALASGPEPRDLLFSPACSSFDAFPNFKARAQAFRELLPLPFDTKKV